MIPKVPKRAGRTKKTRKKDRNATPEEKFHMGRIKAAGCVCCGLPADYHHETHGGAVRDHRRGYGVCKEHHIVGHPYSRHEMGFEAFQEWWELDLEEIMTTRWAESQGIWKDG